MMESADRGDDAGNQNQLALMQCFEQMFALSPVPRLSLTNIYKEILISYPATICDVKGDHLELLTNELQLAAISQCHQAYIKSPHFEKPIHGRLHSIDVRRNLVRLCSFSYTDFEEEKRLTLRVRFKRPVGTVLHWGSDQVSGVIHDISLGGCCLNTFGRIDAGSAEDVEVELKLIDHKTSQACPLKIPGSIIRLQGEAPPFKCALQFRHSLQTERVLAAFINQRQLEILKELRESL